MKKALTKKLSLTLAAFLLACLCLPGLAADPGSSADPLVSMSYINDVLMPQVRSYVDSKTMEGTSSAYKIVNLKKGQTVIGAQSTEFILRMGTASVVATEKGGLADVTAGYDLPNGSVMPANHLLIVPFEDWRGVTMQSDGILMIKGVYSVHN